MKPKQGWCCWETMSNYMPGDPVERTNRVTDIPVGNGLIGRVINPLGEPMDDKGPISFTQRFPIERPAPPIMNREAVNVPLQTGIKVIDAIIPIGRGQRELILGDRQTGKTSIAIDTILTNKIKMSFAFIVPSGSVLLLWLK